VYARLTAAWLGVLTAAVTVVQGDSERVPFGRGSYASRSAALGGAALHRAVRALIAMGQPVAASLLGVPEPALEFVQGSYRVMDDHRTISLLEVARASRLADGEAVGLRGSGVWGAPPEDHPNTCHVCEVEVDLETGDSRVDRYVAVTDTGRLIDPAIAEGQVIGGLLQGVGQALTEEALYDAQGGDLLTRSLGSYGFPRIGLVDTVLATFEEIPSVTNPLGVKGVGEIATLAAPAAVTNAVLDALTAAGVNAIDMPVTAQRVCEALGLSPDSPICGERVGVRVRQIVGRRRAPE
jgi:carbon-monoxide dehydrogenase large subunit